MRFLASWWRVFAELLVLALLGVSLLAEQPLVLAQADSLGDAMPAVLGICETLLVFIFGALYCVVAYPE